MTLAVDDLLGLAPVIPVVVVEDLEDAVPLARALVAGGLPAIEVTLRTPAGAAAIERIGAEVEGAVVGAGTVVERSPGRRRRSPRARASSSRRGPRRRCSARSRPRGVPFLPGVATASDVVGLLERDVTVAKLFPAAASGGIATLRAFAGPFPQVRFCPTGGIDATTAPDYLALANVPCVGGSWMLPPAAVRDRDWATVEALASAAAALH